MAKQKIYTKLNIKYLCKKNCINVHEIKRIIKFRFLHLDIIAVIRICNYFNIDMDKFVLTDLQMENREI
jgi:hypothetical protein